MNGEPRLLRVLNVNDRDHLPDRLPFVEVVNVQSVVNVQEELYRQQRREFDLFLIDIDMSHVAIPANLEWGTMTDLKPYGPLLALPFLDPGRLAVMVPYSNYWGSPDVQNNGFVLVAISILLSHVHRKPYTLSDARAYIEESVRSPGSLMNGVSPALDKALVLLRRRIESEAQLVDVHLTIQRLENLDEYAQNASLEVPLCDAEGPIAIEFFVEPHGHQRIQLASLFADLLGYRKRLGDKTALSGVCETLESWREKSTPIRGSSGTLYDAVLEVLRMCGQPGTHLKKAAKDTDFVKGGGDLYLLMRLAMECAWVYAWHMYTTPEDRVKAVHRMLGLEGEKYATTLYNRFLGKAGRRGAEVCAEGWRRPFKKDYKGVADAYKLDQDAPAGLTPLEKAMCIQYAVEELSWDAEKNPQARPYPRWMV